MKYSPPTVLPTHYYGIQFLFDADPSSSTPWFRTTVTQWSEPLDHNYSTRWKPWNIQPYGFGPTIVTKVTV